MSEEKKEQKPPVDRRAFMRSAAWGGGIVGVGGLVGYAASRLGGGTPGKRTVTPKLGAEFTYDVSKFQTTDPALRRCEEVRRFAAGVDEPAGVAVGADGRILVAGNGGVAVFSAEGEQLAIVSLKGKAYAVTARADGGFLVGMEGRIEVYGANGSREAVWDGFPEDMVPTSITVAEGHVFVADAAKRVLRRLDAEGKETLVMGAGERSFKVPSPYFCARMAPDGLLRVTNPGEHQVEAWTVDGDYELGWGETSFGVEGFCGCCNPVSIDLFADGSFVTCEKGLPRVKLYDAQGGFEGVVCGPEDFPRYLEVANAGARKAAGAGIYAAIDPEGRIVVLDVIGGEVRVMKRKEAGDE